MAFEDLHDMDQPSIIYHSRRLKALLFLLLSGNLAVYNPTHAAVEGNPYKDTIKLADLTDEYSFSLLDPVNDQFLRVNVAEDIPLLFNRFSATIRFYQLETFLLLKRQNQQFLNHQSLRLKLFLPYYNHNIDIAKSLKV